MVATEPVSVVVPVVDYTYNITKETLFFLKYFFLIKMIMLYTKLAVIRNLVKKKLTYKVKFSNWICGLWGENSFLLQYSTY